MAQVHEITRTAFEQLCDNIYDRRDFSGNDYVVVSCWSEFGIIPTAYNLHINSRKNGLAEACDWADWWNRYYIDNAERLREAVEYEVWHIVDDEPEAEPEAACFELVVDGWCGGVHVRERFETLADAMRAADLIIALDAAPCCQVNDLTVKPGPLALRYHVSGTASIAC